MRSKCLLQLHKLFRQLVPDVGSQQIVCAVERSLRVVGAFGFAPTLLLGVIGGLLADRMDRKRLLMITQSMNLAVTVAMTVVLFTGRVEFWHAYIVIFANGVGSALDMPSRRSIVLDLMGRSGVTNAIAVDSIGMHTSRMVGPALAGVLITAIDVSGAYIVVSAFYLTTVILTRALKLPARRPQQTEGVRSQGVARNLAEGFRYVAGQNTILAAVIVTVLMNLLLFPYAQMVPVIAKNVLDVGPGLMGLLLASEGFGAFIGAVGIASAANITRHGRFFLGGSLLALLAILAFSASGHYGLTLVILIVAGLGTSGFGTMQATIVILVAREEMRGRALGVMTLAIGASPLGALLVGGLASAIGPTEAVALMAGVGIVSVAIVGVLMPSLRRRITPDERPQAGPEAPKGGPAPEVSRPR
ncbi:MAG: MFS transporter [Chloroflexi bacterium]|nr:MFS transporter [Chloroflexota bacterium]